MTAHQGLNRLGRQLPTPARVEVLCAYAPRSPRLRASPRSSDFSATKTCPNAGAHRANRGAVGQIALPIARWEASQQEIEHAFAMPRLPSQFRNRVGLTLCGITDEPVSPQRLAERNSQSRCSFQMSRQNPSRIVSLRRHDREQLGDKVVAFDLRGQRIPGGVRAVLRNFGCARSNRFPDARNDAR